MIIIFLITSIVMFIAVIILIIHSSKKLHKRCKIMIELKLKPNKYRKKYYDKVINELIDSYFI